MQHPEQTFQFAVADYLRMVLTDTDAWWTYFPSGGGGKLRGAFLKMMGLKPGAPDIWIVRSGGQLYCLELKSRKGRLSAAQKITFPILRALGVPIAEVRDLRDVEGALFHWGFPLRARLLV